MLICFAFSYRIPPSFKHVIDFPWARSIQPKFQPLLYILLTICLVIGRSPQPEASIRAHESYSPRVMDSCHWLLLEMKATYRLLNYLPADN